jgi:hypothetical protein
LRSKLNRVIIVEAVTVGRSRPAAPRSPLLSRFWYLSSLTSGFCEEFRANVMIPGIGVGGGYARIAHDSAHQPSRSDALSKIYFRAEINKTYQRSFICSTSFEVQGDLESTIEKACRLARLFPPPTFTCSHHEHLPSSGGLRRRNVHHHRPHQKDGYRQN